MDPGQRFRVAICGAGIAGLTCALALSRSPNIDIDVYEGASKLAEVGAGIGLFPRPWRVMQLLGLDRDLLKLTDIEFTDDPVATFTYRKSDQLEGLDFYTLITRGPLITLYRAEFQQVLIRHLPRSCKLYTSKQIRSYSQNPSEPIQLLFEDGSTALCDILIGADGIKSAVRRCLLEEKAVRARSEGKGKDESYLLSCIDPAWSGHVAYRVVIPSEAVAAKHPEHSALTKNMQYLGKNAFVISYPISQGRLINVAAFLLRHDLENTVYAGSWITPSSKEEFLDRFTDWEPEVKHLIECIDKPLLKWAVHTVKPLTSFVSDRVVLVGDAAHAMTPYQGSGAGQAIEDAYVLATLLNHPLTRRDTVYRSLSIFDEVRRPVANNVMERSRINGRYLSLDADGFDFQRPQVVNQLKRLGQLMTRNWEWAWLSSVEELAEDALRRLERS